MLTTETGDREPSPPCDRHRQHSKDVKHAQAQNRDIRVKPVDGEREERHDDDAGNDAGSPFCPCAKCGTGSALRVAAPLLSASPGTPLTRHRHATDTPPTRGGGL